jgi:hypothetical protein
MVPFSIWSRSLAHKSVLMELKYNENVTAAVGPL